MNIKTLKHLFLEELTDMYDAERRIAMALPEMARAATCDRLQQVLLSHLEETEGHVKKVEQVFQCFNEKAQGTTCEGIVGLLDEGDEIAADFNNSPAINAAIILAAQKIEHYETASYGCLREWARLLGNAPAVSLLQDILHDEMAMNENLAVLARATCDQAALGESGEIRFQTAPASAQSALHAETLSH
jgi:ferritin-like metal-binding protein YciE